MKSTRVFDVSILGALSLALAGCGGGSKGAAQAPQYNPYGPNYNTQVSQPYTCQQGQIQLRNVFGRAQCYPTTNLAQACSQAGHVMTSSGQCRYERKLGGTSRHYFTSANVFDLIGRRRKRDTFDRQFGAIVQVQAALYAGESLKVTGDVDNASWDAELTAPMGIPVGSTSSGDGALSDGGNFTIVGQGNSPYSQQSGGYSYNAGANSCYVSQNGVCNAGYVRSNANQCCPNGQYGNSYTGVMSQEYAYPQVYTLRFRFTGRDASVVLRTAAIACEDGRGNSYSCL